MTPGQPTTTITAVVPLFNAERLIERILAPLLGALQRGELAEIIVVDDCSTDDSPQRVRAYPQIRLLRTTRQSGPGGARNLAAETAHGDVLWFVDSDVIVDDNAARVVAECFADPTVTALMGSYDEAPGAQNFLSQYKNLVHHYYHQRGREEASTFWAGCGAVRTREFRAIQGFDAKRYRFPSIEDIDLGYRLRAAGGRIILDKRLQGKHLKEWRIVNLLHTEIFRRAIPWSALMLERGAITNDLNVGHSERARGVLAVSCLAVVVLTLGGWLPWWGVVVMLCASVLANIDFIRFFTRTRNVWFATRAFFFHQAYYCYSSAAFAWAVLRHTFRRRASTTTAD